MTQKKFEILVFLSIFTLFNLVWVFFNVDTITFNFFYALTLFLGFYRICLCQSAYVADIKYLDKDYTFNPKINYKMVKNLQDQYVIYCRKDEAFWLTNFYHKLDTNLCGLDMDKMNHTEFKIFAEHYVDTVMLCNLMHDNYSYVKGIKDEKDEKDMTQKSLRWITLFFASLIFLSVYTNNATHIKRVLKNTFTFSVSQDVNDYYDNTYRDYDDTYRGW